MTLTTTLEPTVETVTRPEITDEHAAFSGENGFLALADAQTPDEVQALRDETVRICRGEGDVAGLPPVGRDDSDDDVIRRTLCVHFPYKLSSAYLARSCGGL